MRPIQTQQDTFALRLAAGPLHLPTEELWNYRQFNPGWRNQELGDDGWDRSSLERSIGRDGILDPVTVTTDGVNAMLEDGHHRVGLARKHGISHIPTNVIRVGITQPNVFRSSAVGPSLKSHLEQRLASALDDYRTERHRQEVELERQTGGYSADKADYLARGGKPTITYKDWLKSRKKGPGEQAAAEAGVDPNFHYTPDSSWGGEAPSWLTAMRFAMAYWVADGTEPVHHIPTSEAMGYRQLLDPNEHLGDEGFAMSDLRNSIAQEGVRDPIEILTDGNRAFMGDGSHRTSIAHELNIPHVPAHVVKMSPDDLDFYHQSAPALHGRELPPAGPAVGAVP